MVWRVGAGDGKEQGKIDAGTSLAVGPVLLRGRLLVGTRDGSLLEIK